jgi:hypothetical protein
MRQPADESTSQGDARKVFRPAARLALPLTSQAARGAPGPPPEEGDGADEHAEHETGRCRPTNPT